jgi:hypothetical protein
MKKKQQQAKENKMQEMIREKVWLGWVQEKKIK